MPSAPAATDSVLKIELRLIASFRKISSPSNHKAGRSPWNRLSACRGKSRSSMASGLRLGLAGGDGAAGELQPGDGLGEAQAHQPEEHDREGRESRHEQP